ncbi:hypothetical protein PR202_gb22037 [Eleusine coracana subsp. coracana]|uniref:Uncharacterized protein n=1 Tax=Eleusine coracana subsp. coracana TaxID=191504 RepID=A0AAV5FEW6_ELECO|nr:hypothetical protein PR202_gb22037 [Eleusine coracana subsp. coracana]
MVAATLCLVAACISLAVYLLYHVLWLAPERLRAALRSQGIHCPKPSFPYGNLAEMRQLSSAAQAAIISKTTPAAAGDGDGDHHQRRSGIVHHYRPAVFPFYDKWRNDYGPVFSYSIGNMVFLHASRCDVVRDLSLCVSASELGKSSYMKATHRPLFGDGILKSSGATWARQRKLLAPEFFPDKVRAMVGLMVASATSLLVNSWQHRLDDATASNNNNGGVVELKVDDDIRAYSADVISRTCFGSSSVMNNSKGERIFAVIRELQKAVAKPNLLAEMTGLSFLPTRSNRAAWRLNRLVRQLILDIAKKEKDDDDENENINSSLLSAMLRKSSGEEDFDFVVDNCKNIYFAGYETTAVTAAWCMMLLALHPDWQDQVRHEVQQACAHDVLDLAALQKMKKLTMVIQETLRLYPAGSVVSRQALRDVTLGGVRVPAGVNIYVPVSTLHLDTDLWGADAAEFDPARFHLGLSPRYVHAPALRLIVEPEHGVRLVLKNVHKPTS